MVFNTPPFNTRSHSQNLTTLVQNPKGLVDVPFRIQDTVKMGQQESCHFLLLLQSSTDLTQNQRTSPKHDIISIDLYTSYTCSRWYGGYGEEGQCRAVPQLRPPLPSRLRTFRTWRCCRSYQRLGDQTSEPWAGPPSPHIMCWDASLIFRWYLYYQFNVQYWSILYSCQRLSFMSLVNPSGGWGEGSSLAVSVLSSTSWHVPRHTGTRSFMQLHGVSWSFSATGLWSLV